MLFGLLKQNPPLDEENVQFLLATFAWAQQQFGAEVFRDHTVLVLPSNEFFPGRVDSVHGMAELVFGQVLEYAGMSRWPLRLAPPDRCLSDNTPQLTISGPLRGEQASVALVAADQAPVELAYDPQMVNNPEILIASFAHNLAALLEASVEIDPPGGPENRPFATEVLAVYLGFGVMLANSAKTIQVHSCGSCGAGQKQRRSFLSQWDITYALAIFSALKGVDRKRVLPALQSHLRPFYKQAVRDLDDRSDALAALSGYW